MRPISKRRKTGIITAFLIILILLLPSGGLAVMNTTAEGAAVVAEEIRRTVEALGIEHEGIKSVITVSVGVAALVPDPDTDPEDLIDAADRVLYMAKEESGNKVVVWENRQEGTQ